jgi:hypothetical protein
VITLEKLVALMDKVASILAKLQNMPIIQFLRLERKKTEKRPESTLYGRFFGLGLIFWFF